MALAITYEQIKTELIEEGRRQVALEMLRERMAPELVARLTKFSIDQLPRLEEYT